MEVVFLRDEFGLVVCMPACLSQTLNERMNVMFAFSGEKMILSDKMETAIDYHL